MSNPVFKRLLACALAIGWVMPAWSQGAYPNRPVKIIVAFPPGQATDQTARAIAQKLSESLGQQFFVENRPGAASIIGSEAAAKAPPDGYTLSWDHPAALPSTPACTQSCLMTPSAISRRSRRR